MLSEAKSRFNRGKFMKAAIQQSGIIPKLHKSKSKIKNYFRMVLR